MSEPLTLLDLWLSRLAGETAVDLVEDGPAVVPELLRVYTPDDFEVHLLDGSWLRAQDGHVIVELTAELTPLNGVAVSSGVIQRRIDTSARHAEHVKLELPEEARGEGRGRSLLRASADLYANLGLERISLLAVDKGRYVWAAAGFSFANEEARQDVIHDVESTAELLDLGFADLDPETCEPWEIAFLPPVDDISLGEALEVLSPDLLEEYGEDADLFRQPLDRPGKLLLLAESVRGWQGALDLRQHDGNRGLEVLYDYTD